MKQLWQGFSGGPDFTAFQTKVFHLEDQQLVLKLPQSPLPPENITQQVNYPFNQEGWFEQHAKRHFQHSYVSLFSEMWPYTTALPHPIPLANALGFFQLSVRLKKIPKEKAKNGLDLTVLGEHLIDEYDKHFNSPEIGEYGQGLNTEIRQKSIAWAKERTPPWQGKELEDLIQSDLTTGRPPLEAAIQLKLGALGWVYYWEGDPNKSLSKRHYCTPLTDDYYLSFTFIYKISRHDKFKKWKANARAAEKRILEMVELGPIPAIERPALEAPVANIIE